MDEFQGATSKTSVRSGGRSGEESESMLGMEGHRRRSFATQSMIPERINLEITKRYDIDQSKEGLLGAGGYGKVFIGKDRQFDDRKVAIKKLPAHDPEKKAAFLTEVKIMKELDHPNICKLLETYEQGRHMYFVLELCEGREVFDRIMDLGQISEAATADIMKQAASALKYAHGRGIAHRDIKPENLCFCDNDPDNNQIKVIDWGLGFYFGQFRMTSAVGSLTYAAPEVLDAQKQSTYTSACDLWSLGVVGYVMICGKAPFWGSYNEQLRKMKKEQFPMQDSTWQRTSAEAKDFIRQLLRAKPEQRIPIDRVLNHPWLSITHRPCDPQLTSEVLANLKRFSNTSQFFSLCVNSVARQLDHKNLRDVHKVFCEIDKNGDGVLDLNEVRAGFESIYGKGSQQVLEVEDMFRKLDLDGSGTIDYTEFCAAGLGEHFTTQENVLWAAFRAFDVHDDDGKITVDEIKQVLKSSDVQKAWSEEVCTQVAMDIMNEFDQNGDQVIEFDEFVKVMHEGMIRTEEKSTPSTLTKAGSFSEAVRAQGLKRLDAGYHALEASSRLKSPGTLSTVSRGLSSQVGAAGNCVPSCGGGIREKGCAIS